MYNAVTRDVEAELLPCCRALGMRFLAYNPLAGGLLTGRYASFDALDADVTPDTRFGGAGGYGKGYGKMYQDRFWKQSYFDAVEEVRATAAAAAAAAAATAGGEPAAGGVSLVEAALRWLYHHSALSGQAGDGVIIGGSRLSQVEANLAAVQQSPLQGMSSRKTLSFSLQFLSCVPSLSWQIN